MFMFTRFQVLDYRKELLVPTPRQCSGLFNRFLNTGTMSKKELRTLASSRGIDNMSVPVSMDDPVSIDLVVLGSVAVDKLGHRIGKGEGFVDLEFALARGAVTEDTVVVTTVHDCQVFASLPGKLFQDHDVPVDVIVTPTTLIRVETRLRKPSQIIWDILSEEKLNQIPLLRQLQPPAPPRASNYINEEPRIISRRKSKKIHGIGFNFFKIPKEVRISEFKEMLRGTGAKMTFVIWKAYKQSALVFFEGDKNEIFNKIEHLEIMGQKLEVKENLAIEGNDVSQKEVHRSQSQKKKRAKEDEYGIFFGKIPRSCKKSEFRKLLADRQIFPDHLNWNGRNGYASAFWNNQEVDLILQLEDLIIEDQKIVVEPFKRKKEDTSSFKQEIVWKTEVEIKLTPPFTEFLLVENTCETDQSETVAVSLNKTKEIYDVSEGYCVPSDDIFVQEEHTEKSDMESRGSEAGVLDNDDNELFSEVCKTDYFESIPSFCDIIRDAQVSPHLICDASTSYKVQESTAQLKSSPSNFSKVVHQVKRNASKRSTTHETQKESISKVAVTKITPLSQTQSMYVSIDTEENREKNSKASSPAKHSSNKKDRSHKTDAAKAEEKQKIIGPKVVMTRDSSSKRGSSSDNKSQFSGDSPVESKLKTKSGAEKKPKSSPNTNHTASKLKDYPSKYESQPSKDKECILS